MSGNTSVQSQAAPLLEPLEPRLLLSAIPPYFDGDIDLATETGTGPDGVIRIFGNDPYDDSGISVSSAGDVNGDAYDDFLIGAYHADQLGGDEAGETYLVFGHAGDWWDIDFNEAVPSTTAIRILGDDDTDLSGTSVSSAGDVNGDGYDDFLIGAAYADPAGRVDAGETYLVFGHDGAWSDIDLDTGTGTGPDGVVRILGDDASGYSGHSVSSAGDVNGDTYDDFLIGAYAADPAGGAGAGETYLVFGHADARDWLDIDFGAEELSATAIRILGDDAGDYSGISVSSAGDVDGDNYDDLLIGAYWADTDGGPDAGETYLVFGHAGGWSDIDFNGDVLPATAIRILGDDLIDKSGVSVSSAGNVNGDAYDDILIGAYFASQTGGTGAGETYLVFGHGGPWSEIDLDTETGTGPVGVVRILGDDAADLSGVSVSSAGDVNDDGYDDLLIGAYWADTADGLDAGETYLVFGHDGTWSDIDFGAEVSPTTAIRILGDDAGDLSGGSVSSAGDVNGDGYDDFLIGAPQADPAGGPNAGETYLVFGRPSEDPGLPSMIEGLVWEDFNNDGEVNFGEKAIAGVRIDLVSTDDLAPVSAFAFTNEDGFYEFTGLRPGTYDLSEIQPAGFDDGTDSAGTVNGLPSGTAVNPGDEILGIVLPAAGSIGINYNFGERVPSSGVTVSDDQVAAAGFWHNKHGQELILALNGGSTSTQLGDWLAATFPNMYGASAGDNDLTGKDNAYVAAFYQSLLHLNGKTTPGGPPKLDAKVFSVALATYATNSTLAGEVAADYGLEVSEGGAGTALFDVGDSGDAFGVPDNSLVTILDLLLATNDRTVDGILYDVDGDEEIDDWEITLRYLAHDLYAAICESG